MTLVCLLLGLGATASWLLAWRHGVLPPSKLWLRLALLTSGLAIANAVIFAIGLRLSDLLLAAVFTFLAIMCWQTFFRTRGAL